MKHLYSWIAICGFCVAPPELFAQFAFETNNNGSVTIFSYSGSGGAVTIPSLHNGLPVTIIGTEAFSGSSGTFNGRLITSLTIPDSVASIETGAFDSCVNLANVTFGTNLMSLGDSAFINCGKLASVTLPNVLTNIGSSAFGSCTSLTNITVGTNLIALGENAFEYCGHLAGISLPRSLTNIGAFAFYECTNLAAITVDPQNPVYSSAGGVLFDKSRTTLLQFPGGKPGSYAVPNSVTNIGDGALWNCVNLTNISIPSSVLAMQQGAFSGCTSLTGITVDGQNPNYSSVAGVLFDKMHTTLLQYPGGRAGGYAIPKGVTSVGDIAFSFCSSLTNVTIPASVTSIGAYAFEECLSLTGLLFAGNTPTNFGATPFFSDNSATIYYLPGTSGWETFSGPPTVLWNPLIQTADGVFGARSNQFGFTITGTAGIPIAVEACTDLSGAGWQPLLSCTLTNGSIYFSDPAWTNHDARFYGIGFP